MEVFTVSGHLCFGIQAEFLRNAVDCQAKGAKLMVLYIRKYRILQNRVMTGKAVIIVWLM